MDYPRYSVEGLRNPYRLLECEVYSEVAPNEVVKGSPSPSDSRLLGSPHILKRKYNLILGVLESYSGVALFARDISETIKEDVSSGVTAKSIGRRMVWLEELGYVARIAFEGSETMTNRCRYEYMWVPPELRGIDVEN